MTWFGYPGKHREKSSRPRRAMASFTRYASVRYPCGWLVQRFPILERRRSLPKWKCEKFDNMLEGGQHDTAGTQFIHVSASPDRLAAMTRDTFPMDNLRLPTVRRLPTQSRHTCVQWSLGTAPTNAPSLDWQLPSCLGASVQA